MGNVTSKKKDEEFPILTSEQQQKIKKPRLGEPPNAYECALMSLLVYKTPPLQQTIIDTPGNYLALRGWKIFRYSTKGEAGHYGMALINDTSRQLVIAHRGTSFTNFDSVVADLAGVVGIGVPLVGGDLQTQQDAAFKFTMETIDQASKRDISVGNDIKNFQLWFAGHSLGAFIAVDCVTQKALQKYQPAAKVFDNPGNYEMVRQREGISGTNVLNTAMSDSDIAALPILNIVSAPNWVNTCNEYIGEVIRVYPTAATEQTDIKKWFMYHLDQHSIKNIIATFDPTTGLPKRCKRVIRWPKFDWKGFANSLGDVASSAVSLFSLNITVGNFLNLITSVKKALDAKGQLAKFYQYADENYDADTESLPYLSQYHLSYLAHYQTEDMQFDHIDVRNLHPKVVIFIDNFIRYGAAFFTKDNASDVAVLLDTLCRYHFSFSSNNKMLNIRRIHQVSQPLTEKNNEKKSYSKVEEPITAEESHDLINELHHVVWEFYTNDSYDAVRSNLESYKSVPIEQRVLQLEACITAIGLRHPTVKGYLQNQLSDFINQRLRAVYLDRARIDCLFIAQGVLPIDDSFINLVITEQQQAASKTTSKTYAPFANDTLSDEDTASSEKLMAIFPLPLTETSRALITANAGTGKTTTCKFIIRKWAQGKVWSHAFTWLFWIPLRNINYQNYPQREKPYSLVDIIYKECFSSLGLPLTDQLMQYICEVISSQEVGWILDGADELQQQLRDNRMENIHLNGVIRNLYEQPYYAVASRPYYLNDLKAITTRLEVFGFTTKNIYMYIDRFFTTFGKERAEELKLGVNTLLEQYPDLMEMVHTPIYLELICTAIYFGWKPEKRFSITELFSTLIMQILKRRLVLEVGDSVINYSQVDVYKQSALALHTFMRMSMEGAKKGTAVYPATFLQDIFMKAAKEFEKRQGAITQPVIQVVLPYGFIVGEGSGASEIEKDYHYIHLTISYYFAALQMVYELLTSNNIDNRIGLSKKYMYAPGFETVWRFVIGILTDEKSILSHYSKSKRYDILGRLIRVIQNLDYNAEAPYRSILLGLVCWQELADKTHNNATTDEKPVLEVSSDSEHSDEESMAARGKVIVKEDPLPGLAHDFVTNFTGVLSTVLASHNREQCNQFTRYVQSNSAMTQLAPFIDKMMIILINPSERTLTLTQNTLYLLRKLTNSPLLMAKIRPLVNKLCSSSFTSVRYAAIINQLHLNQKNINHDEVVNQITDWLINELHNEEALEELYQMSVAYPDVQYVQKVIRAIAVHLKKQKDPEFWQTSTKIIEQIINRWPLYEAQTFSMLCKEFILYFFIKDSPYDDKCLEVFLSFIKENTEKNKKLLHDMLKILLDAKLAYNFSFIRMNHLVDLFLQSDGSYRFSFALYLLGLDSSLQWSQDLYERRGYFISNLVGNLPTSVIEIAEQYSEQIRQLYSSSPASVELLVNCLVERLENSERIITKLWFIENIYRENKVKALKNENIFQLIQSINTLAGSLHRTSAGYALKIDIEIEVQGGYVPDVFSFYLPLFENEDLKAIHKQLKDKSQERGNSLAFSSVVMHQVIAILNVLLTQIRPGATLTEDCALTLQLVIIYTQQLHTIFFRDDHLFFPEMNKPRDIEFEEYIQIFNFRIPMAIILHLISSRLLMISHSDSDDRFINNTRKSIEQILVIICETFRFDETQPEHRAHNYDIKPLIVSFNNFCRNRRRITDGPNIISLFRLFFVDSVLNGKRRYLYDNESDNQESNDFVRALRNIFPQDLEGSYGREAAQILQRPFAGYLMEFAEDLLKHFSTTRDLDTANGIGDLPWSNAFIIICHQLRLVSFTHIRKSLSDNVYHYPYPFIDQLFVFKARNSLALSRMLNLQPVMDLNAIKATYDIDRRPVYSDINQRYVDMFNQLFWDLPGKSKGRFHYDRYREMDPYLMLEHFMRTTCNDNFLGMSLLKNDNLLQFQAKLIYTFRKCWLPTRPKSNLDSHYQLGSHLDFPYGAGTIFSFMNILFIYQMVPHLGRELLMNFEWFKNHPLNSFLQKLINAPDHYFPQIAQFLFLLYILPLRKEFLPHGYINSRENINTNKGFIEFLRSLQSSIFLDFDVDLHDRKVVLKYEYHKHSLYWHKEYFRVTEALPFLQYLNLKMSDSNSLIQMYVELIRSIQTLKPLIDEPYPVYLFFNKFLVKRVDTQCLNSTQLNIIIQRSTLPEEVVENLLDLLRIQSMKSASISIQNDLTELSSTALKGNNWAYVRLVEIISNKNLLVKLYNTDEIVIASQSDEVLTRIKCLSAEEANSFYNRINRRTSNVMPYYDKAAQTIQTAWKKNKEQVLIKKGKPSKKL